MSDWRLFKHFCSGLPQYGLNVPASDYTDTGTRFIRTSDVNDRGEMTGVEPVYVNDSLIGPSHRLVEGDLLLSRSGTLGRCLRYRRRIGKATFAGYLIRFRPNDEGDPRYLEYCTQSKFFQQAIEGGAPSSTISNFNAERYANLQLPWWPFEQQRTIADYLDIETGRIDALISKKHRMIEVLEERLLFVARALTTGGGEIAPLRRFVRAVKTGTTPPASALSELVASEIGWYSPGDVGPNLKMLAPARSLSKRAVSEGWAPEFPPDSTLVVGIGATAGRVGHNVAASTGNQQMTCITPNTRVVPRFLSWQLWARAEELRETAPYTTLPILNNDFLRSILIAVPAWHLQQAIGERLDQVADGLLAITNGLQAQINLLAERRQALITAAVTGELAIPGVAA